MPAASETTHEISIETAERSAATKSHGSLYALDQILQDPVDAGLAACSKSVEVWPPEHDGAGAERAGRRSSTFAHLPSRRCVKLASGRRNCTRERIDSKGIETRSFRLSP